jgi:hypothetical protein
MYVVRESLGYVVDALAGTEVPVSNEELMDRYVRWMGEHDRNVSRGLISLVNKAVTIMEEDPTAQVHTLRSNGIRFGIALFASRLVEQGALEPTSFYQHMMSTIGRDVVMFLHSSVHKNSFFGPQPFKSYTDIIGDLEFAADDVTRLAQRLV